MESPDVSFILVSYNTEKLTKDCITSIYEKTSGISFDIWVVDNNSSDDTCNMIKREFPNVNLVENKENIGFGCANNIAMKKSKAKYLFLLNTDTVLINNAAKILFDYMENNPNTGASGGNLYNINNENVHSYGYFQTLKSKLIRTLHLGNFFPDEKIKIEDKGENKENELKEVDIIVGADLFLRKSILEEVGYFDEDFFLYDEESELQFRIKKAGYKIFIIPESKIYHLEGQSNKDRVLSRTYKMVSEIIFYKKCYGRKHLELYKCICCLPNLPRLLFHPKIIYKSLSYIRKI